MKISRKEFIKYSGKISAATALLTGAAGSGRAFGDSDARSRPNILLLMVDQQRIPPLGYGTNEGEAQGLKEILGFQALSPDNSFVQFFPGYLRLRQNAVVLRTHYTASSACVPSRACIMTGSYSTGVDDTDGLFKSVEDVTFLDPDGTPTIGDWFRAAGYSTHYFGKWHVSDPQPPHYMKPWGFSDWKSSYPEPHGGGPDNLGVYRDIGFTNAVVDFLAEKGRNHSSRPWLAVGSLVNPHDNGNYPSCWQLPADQGIVPWVNFPPPPPIPAEGEQSLPDANGLIVDLNPDGFPQDNSFLPPTLEESLVDKPSCQKDYSLKMGIAFEATWEFNNIPSPYPYQFREESSAWFLRYIQFYQYCHYLADLQLRRMLQALDDNGLAENTIVVFLSDHGEMAGAHGGMIQKWHNAYEETIRVPMVISSPLVNASKEEMREILQPTSSIDLVPTLLALAGIDEQKMRGKVGAIYDKEVAELAGADLSSHIKGECMGPILRPDGTPRTGVLFRSKDTVTEIGLNPSDDVQDQYDLFLQRVDDARADGYPLAPGSVRQPNNVRALCTGDWKIVQYMDPDNPQSNEWELYCLAADPIEQTNLVDFRTGEVRDDVTVPGLTRDELVLKNSQLKEELARQEAAILDKSS